MGFTLKVSNPPVDFPLDEIRTVAHKLIAEGATVIQKFSCDACEARQQVKEPDAFYPFYECANCGNVTDIQKRGCNYAVILNLKPDGDFS